MRRDIQHKDIQHKDIQHKDIQHKDIVILNRKYTYNILL